MRIEGRQEPFPGREVDDFEASPLFGIALKFIAETVKGIHREDADRPHIRRRDDDLALEIVERK